MHESDLPANEAIAPGDESLTARINHRIATRLEQLVTGLPITARFQPACTCCQTSLQAGDDVSIYAARSCDGDTWSLVRLYCEDDQPEHVGTLGKWDGILHGRLATLSDPRQQRHQPAIVGVTVQSVIPPTQGVTAPPTSGGST